MAASSLLMPRFVRHCVLLLQALSQLSDELASKCRHYRLVRDFLEFEIDLANIMDELLQTLCLSRQTFVRSLICKLMVLSLCFMCSFIIIVGLYS